MKDHEGIRLLERLKKIRRDVANDDRFLILSVCTDDSEAYHECWQRFVEAQGKIDYGDRDRPAPIRFTSDPKWVNAIQDASHFVSTKAYGVEHLPEAFLIGPDERLRAVRIPIDKLSDVVAEALKKTP